MDCGDVSDAVLPVLTVGGMIGCCCLGAGLVFELVFAGTLELGLGAGLTDGCPVGFALDAVDAVDTVDDDDDDDDGCPTGLGLEFLAAFDAVDNDAVGDCCPEVGAGIGTGAGLLFALFADEAGAVATVLLLEAEELEAGAGAGLLFA